jgi:predicted metalloprotease with PDZ domain
MRNYLILLAFFSFLSGICAQQPKVRIEIAPLQGQPEQGLDIAVHFEGAATGQSKVHYANDSWGESKLWEGLTDLQCTTAGTSVTLLRDSGQILIQHKPQAALTLRFNIKQVQSNPVAESYQTIFQPTWFHVFGHHLLALPDHVYASPSDVVPVELVWNNWPGTWVLHNSFGHNERKQLVTMTQGELTSSVFMGGTDFRFYDFELEKNKVWLVMRGEWPAFKDAELVDQLKKVIQTQRDFWRDHSQPYYSVSLIPLYGQWDSLYQSCGITGTGLTNAFAAAGTNNPCMDMYLLRYIFNHELMHNWIGNVIQVKHEELQYWFSEGFTDYYTRKNMLLNGTYSPQEFFDEMNKEVFKKHYTNPQRSAPNYMIRDSFWANYDLEKLPYRRGAIFAFWLDQQIKIISNFQLSLDDLMRDIQADSKGKTLSFTDESFLALAQKYLHYDLSYFFQRHIIVGELIDFATQPLPEYIKLIPATADGYPQLQWLPERPDAEMKLRR